MVVIGIDSHKDTLVGCLIDAAGRPLEHRSIANVSAGHRELVAWAQGASVGRVAVEGSGGYGCAAAVALVEAGIEVVDVPPQMTAAARRGGRTATKSDPTDALLIARIGARDTDLPRRDPTAISRSCAGWPATAVNWSNPAQRTSTASTPTWRRSAAATTTPPPR